MKRWGRVAVVVALLPGVIWGVRAAYLFRVWQIAQIWAGLPSVTPPASAFFAPDTWGTTRHGAYADIVFLRIGMGDRAKSFASAWNALPPTTQASPSNRCDDTGWGRNMPSQITPANLAPCYRVAESFGTPTGTPRSVTNGTDRGGTAWVNDADTLYLAVYRLR